MVPTLTADKAGPATRPAWAPEADLGLTFSAQFFSVVLRTDSARILRATLVEHGVTGPRRPLRDAFDFGRITP
jgi:hypothetical protein